jgi:hypothetical protein
LQGRARGREGAACLVWCLSREAAACLVSGACMSVDVDCCCGDDIDYSIIELTTHNSKRDRRACMHPLEAKREAGFE